MEVKNGHLKDNVLLQTGGFSTSMLDPGRVLRFGLYKGDVQMCTSKRDMFLTKHLEG